MSNVDMSAFAAETPERKRARLALAIMNSLMAGAIGALTLGIWQAVTGALTMAALPYAPVLWRVIPEWVQANIITGLTAAFLLSAIVGTLALGISVAFYLALALVPVMLGLIVAVALSNPSADSAD